MRRRVWEPAPGSRAFGPGDAPAALRSSGANASRTRRRSFETLGSRLPVAEAGESWLGCASSFLIDVRWCVEYSFRFFPPASPLPQTCCAAGSNSSDYNILRTTTQRLTDRN